MFAAYFQPSWPSRPKTKGTLLFYFLKLYNYGFLWNFCGINWFWATAPMDLKKQPWTKKIAKKQFFRLNFEVLVINRFLWNFTWSLQFAWIQICEFIKKLHVYEKWAFFYVMEAQKWPFSVFSCSWKIDWSNFFFSFPPENFYDIWPQPMKILSKSIKFLLHKILWRFRQIGKWKFSQLH